MAEPAESSCVSSAPSTQIAAVVALAAFALAGCNASEGPNPSSQRNLANIYPNYSPYNPIEYAQTSGFYGGR
jgi:hypothetical protein